MSTVVGAGVLVLRGDRVLAISRGRQRSNLGLPGGRVDPTDSNPRHTAARELVEETGVQVRAPRLRFLAASPTPQGGIYVAYLASEIVSWPSVLRSTPFEGYVGWHRPEELLRPEVTHRIFHRRLFTQIGL